MSINKLLLLLWIIIISLLTCGCARVIIGLHKPKLLSDKEIKRYEGKYNIKNTKIDAEKYISYLKAQPPDIQKRTYHPCQMMWFEKDTLKNWIVNCDVGGFPKLNWEVDSLFSREDKSYSKLSYDYKSFFDIDTKNTVIVLWCRLLSKPSKQLIKKIQKHERTKTMSIVYVNIDEVFYLLDKQSKSKK